MSEAQNVEVVQDAYAAFGRGDIPGVLAALDDDVVWHPVYGVVSHVATSGVRRGNAAVGEFFKTLAETTTFESFQPREFIAQGEKVVVLGHYVAKTNTGSRVDSDWVTIFTLRNGEVVDFEEFSDSAQLDAAYAPKR
jgi:ketosteroid isomerase-like protein